MLTRPGATKMAESCPNLCEWRVLVTVTLSILRPPPRNRCSSQQNLRYNSGHNLHPPYVVLTRSKYSGPSAAYGGGQRVHGSRAGLEGYTVLPLRAAFGPSSITEPHTEEGRQR